MEPQLQGWVWIAALTVLVVSHAAADTIFVAPNGNDRASGRADAPFATLARARDEVRRIKQRGLSAPVNVIIKAGTYELRDTLRFSPDDSGTEACPITYQAAPGERVVIRGGRAVTGWKPWRGSICQADLKAQGMGGAIFYQLFYKGKRQHLARHPNFDPEHPRTGGFAYVDGVGPKPSQQFCYAAGSIPFDQWSDISQAEIFSVFAHGWNVAITPITAVDKSRRLVTVRRVRTNFQLENRFYVRNVLDALDAPGEWFLDRKASVLYFWPSDGKPADGDVVVPLIDHLIEVKGSIPYPHAYLKVGFKGNKADCPLPAHAPARNPVEQIHFRGLHFQCARQDAVRLIGARRCSVIGCTVTNVGNVGVNLGGVANAEIEVGNPRIAPPKGFSAGVGGGGQNLLFNDPCEECRVAGCDAWALGSEGVFLYGTGNVAENNHVFDIGLFDKDCACINAFGEANVIRRNTLHDVPRNAVFLKGVDNVVELNDISHTVLETCDGGAIRMCQRNLVIRGNVIRFNKIVDTVGFGYPMGRDYQSPYYTWGVYLDDFTCGTTVFGNVIVRTGRGGVHVHGGSDNTVENNIIVDAGQYQYEINPIRKQPATGNTVRRNIFLFDGTDAVVYRCGQWRGPKQVTWENNLVWTTAGQPKVSLARKEIVGWDAWMKEGLAKGSIVADPRFVNPSAGDYRLRPDSPAWKLGFAKIPFGQIGCFASDERVMWPLRAKPGFSREEPVLHKARVRPIDEDFEWDAPRRPPRSGNVMAPGKSSIRVTAKLAAAGKHSLMFVDAPGLAHRWQPRIFYQANYREGAVRFACDLRLDGKLPPEVIIDIRQYTDTGPREYFSGPMISINPKGRLSAGSKALVSVPFDQWFNIECVMPLGDAAKGSFDLAVTVADAEPKRFTIPYRAAEFKRVERIVIISNSDERTIFYVDNVFCGPTQP